MFLIVQKFSLLKFSKYIYSPQREAWTNLLVLKCLLRQLDLKNIAIIWWSVSIGIMAYREFGELIQRMPMRSNEHVDASGGDKAVETWWGDLDCRLSLDINRERNMLMVSWRSYWLIQYTGFWNLSHRNKLGSPFRSFLYAFPLQNVQSQGAIAGCSECNIHCHIKITVHPSTVFYIHIYVTSHSVGDYVADNIIL